MFFSVIRLVHGSSPMFNLRPCSLVTKWLFLALPHKNAAAEDTKTSISLQLRQALCSPRNGQQARHRRRSRLTTLQRIQIEHTHSIIHPQVQPPPSPIVAPLCCSERMGRLPQRLRGWRWWRHKRPDTHAAGAKHSATCRCRSPFGWLRRWQHHSALACATRRASHTCSASQAPVGRLDSR
jgi:hypothetical protein